MNFAKAGGLLLCSFIFSFSRIHAQSLFETQDSTYHPLYQKYLVAPGNEDDKIEALIKLADQANYEGTKTDVIQFIQVALHLEKQRATPSLATFRLNEFAGDITKSFNQGYALEFYKKATAICDEIPVDASDRFAIYTKRAGTHLNLKDPVEAHHWYRKALEAAHLDNSTSIASALNNFGVYLIETGNPDSARWYLEKSLDILRKNMTLSLYCAAKDNLAQLDIARGKFREALLTFMYNDSIYYRVKTMHHKYIPNKIRLLGMMEKTGLPSVHDSILRVQQFIDRYPLDVRPAEVREFYQFAENHYFTKGMRQQYVEYHQRLNWFSDSLQQAQQDQLHLMTTTLLSVQERSFQNELNAQQLKAEQSALRLRFAWRLSIITVLGLISISIVLIMYFKKRKQQLQAQKQMVEAALKNKEMESRLIRQDLELKKKDLTTVVLHNTQVYDHNQKMIGRLQDIHGSEEEMKQQIRTLLQEIQSQNMVGDRSIAVQQQIEVVNTEFYDNLKSRFPDLTKTEAELCGYIRINLSNKDISILKNIEATSVKMGKNRLRKKLGLEENTDLYHFIQQI